MVNIPIKQAVFRVAHVLTYSLQSLSFYSGHWVSILVDSDCYWRRPLSSGKVDPLYKNLSGSR